MRELSWMTVRLLRQCKVQNSQRRRTWFGLPGGTFRMGGASVDRRVVLSAPAVLPLPSPAQHFGSRSIIENKKKDIANQAYRLRVTGAAK